MSRGAVYITLERLEEKGLLTSRLEDASDRRGGRPKRTFRPTAAGIRAVKRALSLVTQRSGPIRGMIPSAQAAGTAFCPAPFPREP